MAAAPDAPVIGEGIDDLPYETAVARAVFERNHRSVVRLQIPAIRKDGTAGGECGTGFIVLSNARHLLIMTCGHSFVDWDEDIYVTATFHDTVRAHADVRFLRRERELALLEVDTRAKPELSNAARYPPVALSQADPRKGGFLVMLGYPTGVAYPHPEMGTFHGSVINETTTNMNADLRMFSADYPAGPGASGAPVFGDDHRVVGLCKGGQKNVSYTVPVSWIRDTLKTGIKGHENATIPEMLQLFSSAWLRAQAQPTGDAAGGSGAAGPSSSTGRTVR